MTYDVKILPLALKQLEAAHDWLKTRSTQHASQWYDAMVDAINSLDEHPARCPKVKPHGDVRFLLAGDKWHAYRINFKIKVNSVVVYTIRHSAQND